MAMMTFALWDRLPRPRVLDVVTIRSLGHRSDRRRFDHHQPSTKSRRLIAHLWPGSLRAVIIIIKFLRVQQSRNVMIMVELIGTTTEDQTTLLAISVWCQAARTMPMNVR